MQVTGRVTIRANGEVLLTQRGAKANLGGVERTGVTGDQSVAGFTEETAVPFIECTQIHRADTNLEALKDLTDATVMFETDTGKSYVLQNAWLATPLELTGGEGEVPLKFEGIRMELVS